MPRPRFQNADAGLKKAILDAATREFGQRGYDAASLNRIIETSGLSKGSFYYYFDDKADLAAHVLVEATLKSTSLDLLDAVVQAPDVPSFWAGMKGFQRSALETMLHSREQLELVARLGTAYVDHPELVAKVAPLIVDLQHRVVAAFTRGQALGAIRDDLPIGQLLAVVQTVKEALIRAAPQSLISVAELERLSALEWDFFTRVVEPKPKSKEAP
jgi:AcrR family transcriptional regulator